jgi:acyl-CoA thioester hydrolase
VETRIQTRWPDFDALGHLNHAVYHVYLDEARDEALRATVGDFNAWPNVVVHASIDYRREVALGVREIIVRTRVTAVGRSSVRFEQTIVTPDGELAAEAEAVLVAWDPQTRRSREITAAERAALMPTGEFTSSP